MRSLSPAAGIALSRVRHILISHLHADHTGLAQSLRELTGAPVWMHRHDAELLRELKTSTKWHTNLEPALRHTPHPWSLARSLLHLGA